MDAYRQGFKDRLAQHIKAAGTSVFKIPLPGWLNDSALSTAADLGTYAGIPLASGAGVGAAAGGLSDTSTARRGALTGAATAAGLGGGLAAGGYAAAHLADILNKFRYGSSGKALLAASKKSIPSKIAVLATRLTPTLAAAALTAAGGVGAYQLTKHKG